jgi:hypothetical protein
MRLFAALLFAAALTANDGPTIFYSKSFPGSSPPYVAITVDKSGNAVYKEAPDDDQPLKFRLKENETAEVFGLAEKLDYFRRPLESGLKVANTGVKTFRYQAGAEQHEVKFNYSQDLDARALADWFERMTETEQHLVRLERAVHFDKLGVYKVLLQLQVSMERNRLVAADQFLPLLDRVSKNESYLHMARERASHLAEVIRAGKSKAE